MKITNTYSKIWEILSKKHKRQLTLLLIISFIATFLEALSIGIIVPILSTLMNYQNAFYSKYLSNLPLIKSKETFQIVLIGLLIGLYIIKGVFLAFQAWYQNSFSFGLTADISNRLFKGYVQQEYDYHLLRNSSDLIRNITTEVGTFSSVLQSGIVILSEISIVASIVILLFMVNPLGAIISFFTLTILAVTFTMVAKKYNQKWGNQRHKYDSLKLSIILQAFDGIKEIKHYCRELFFINRFIEYNNLVIKPTEKQYTLQLIPRIFFEVIAVILCLSYVLIQLVIYKNVNSIIPQIGVLVAASFRLMPSFNRIISSMQIFRFADIVINNISIEIDKLQHAINFKNTQSESVISLNEQIDIVNVSFNYANEKKVFSDISITIKKNQFIAFVGESGAGKSTIVDLILGLLKPTVGKISVDGIDINENLTSWRKIVGYVPQSFYLFNDTILNNIIFSSEGDLDSQKLNLSLHQSQLSSFIAQLPLGIKTQVGEKGSQLSGGQRQRLALARALYFSPRVLILDEPTSALDNVTGNEIMSILNKLHKETDLTIILITHNTNNLRSCDKIFKISDGKIIETEKNF